MENPRGIKVGDTVKVLNGCFKGEIGIISFVNDNDSYCYVEIDNNSYFFRTEEIRVIKSKQSVEYDIVSANKLSILVNEVNKKLSEGWKLQGSPVYTESNYLQAVFKEATSGIHS